MNIIELREKDSTSTNNNGDFNISLKQPVIMENGDSLILKSCFIDSVEANDNKIKITDDITGFYNICDISVTIVTT
jgi:hypothetical protein